MKFVKDMPTTYQITTAIECDKCKKKYEDMMSMQEFVSLSFVGGYGSAWGDGNCVDIDLCSECSLELFSDFARIN